MKVLFLVQDEQKIILDALYAAIGEHCECDLRRLSSEEQADLSGYFKRHVSADNYDRILFFLRFKKELNQIDFIRTVPNLVTLEHDACQNYASGKYKGYFSYYYQSIPWIRVICSGFMLAQRLKAEGTDAICVPKGYDAQLLKNENLLRDIELGFIGSLGADTYSGRKQLLNEIQQRESLSIMVTAPGYEYAACLNRIRFFVSADVGFDEYMIKNFEAMACGCVLFTYSQSDLENEALGFLDMQNVVLYRSVDEFCAKLNLLRNNPTLAQAIALRGQTWVEKCYSFSVIGKKIVDALSQPLQKAEHGKRSIFDTLRLRWKLHSSR